MSALTGVSIRMKGTDEEIAEFQKQLQTIFTVEIEEVFHSKARPGTVFAWFKLTTKQGESLLNQLQICENNLWRVGEMIADLKAENKRLKQQLELISTPEQ